MKTIAITIDEDTLARVDRVAPRNRSRLLRDAAREYVDRLERRADEQREAEIIRRHRGRLARQAGALVRAQAKP